MLETAEQTQSATALLSECKEQQLKKPTPRKKPLSCTLQAVHDLIAPLWPLEDLVAVNPFDGFANRDLLETHQLLGSVRSGDLLLPLEYYRNELSKGTLSQVDVATALKFCQQSHPDYYAKMTLDDVLKTLEQASVDEVQPDGERRFWTAAERIDRTTGSGWARTIVDEISRHCAAHYDRGQAIWPSPWKHLPLYQDWRQTITRDQRMDHLGARGFRSYMSALPNTPEETISLLLSEWKIPNTQLLEFLLCQAYSINGWASHVRYCVRQAEMEGRTDSDLTGLIAIRLAYDAGLIKALSHSTEWVFSELGGPAMASPTPNWNVLVRYLMLVASEQAYRSNLCRKLASNGTPTKPSDSRKTAQMVFCIDVRSEVFRRHLESVSKQVQTFGFAGFFGMPIEYVRFGASSGVAQCPVLISPGVTIREHPIDSERAPQLSTKRNQVRLFRKVWKRFQSSAASCFSFVESFGLWYVGRLVSDAFGWTRPIPSADNDGLSGTGKESLRPDLKSSGNTGLTLEQRTDLAEGALRNLGLTANFARLVVFCGHGSETVNNPYKAGLDCGACGGHSGDPNARLAAQLFNDPEVRARLQTRGIDIPDDTYFVAALHNTTTDGIQFFDLTDLPISHAEDMGQLRLWTEQATNLTRAERALRLGGISGEQLPLRSRDWAEMRPEWGLAGNAAFIAAPRSRTAGLNLNGRTFLHDYDYEQDPDGKVLELILTAPVVVANWINMQYYASAVDNPNFGSGNKTIHNLVGTLGILEGNAGDLKTGLPWQSVHDGEQYQHEPLRLSVLIEAPRHEIMTVLDTHDHVRNLADNGWISLTALEEGRSYHYTPTGWRQGTTESLDTVLV